MVHELAAVLNAEVGCSRPIAEGENWMERERYIGVSGVLLKSDLTRDAGDLRADPAYGWRQRRKSDCRHQ